MCRPENPQRGCAAFWGPTKPFLGGVSAFESSSSHYVSTAVLLTTRALSFILLTGTFGYLVHEGRFEMQFLTSWSFALTIISFAVLTLTSALFVARQLKAVRIVAAIALPLHFVTASAALFITPVYYALLGNPPFDYGNIMPHGGTLLLCLVDLALGAALRFRVQYLAFLVGYILLYLIFVWIRYAAWNWHPDYGWPYGFLDFTTVSPATSVGIYFGLAAWCIVAGIIMLFVTRLVGLCRSKTIPVGDETEEKEATLKESADDAV